MLGSSRSREDKPGTGGAPSTRLGSDHTSRTQCPREVTELVKVDKVKIVACDGKSKYEIQYK